MGHCSVWLSRTSLFHYVLPVRAWRVIQVTGFQRVCPLLIFSLMLPVRAWRVIQVTGFQRVCPLLIFSLMLPVRAWRVIQVTGFQRVCPLLIFCWLLLGPFPELYVADGPRTSYPKDSSKAGVDECLGFFGVGAVVQDVQGWLFPLTFV